MSTSPTDHPCGGDDECHKCGKELPDIRENDVFKFQYSPEETKKRFEPYWCFDGQLVARKYGDKFLLVDTYWSSGSDNREFKPEQARSQGTLTFVCNLDEVEKVSEDAYEYYSESDVFDLSTQHRSYKRFAKRKGAVRDAAKMLETVEKKRKEAENEMDRAGRHLNELAEKKKQIESGNLDVWL